MSQEVNEGVGILGFTRVRYHGDTCTEFSLWHAASRFARWRKSFNSSASISPALKLWYSRILPVLAYGFNWTQQPAKIPLYSAYIHTHSFNDRPLLTILWNCMEIIHFCSSSNDREHDTACFNSRVTCVWNKTVKVIIFTINFVSQNYYYFFLLSSFFILILSMMNVNVADNWQFFKF